jgi:pantoate--beta-alanine ligase
LAACPVLKYPVLKIFHHISSLLNWRDSIDELSGTIGFIPTMGALHAGHVSLIQKAKEECDYVVKYPRMPELDSELLLNCGCDYLFMPKVEEIYPKEVAKPTLNFGALNTVLEGSFRPGHFEGVVQIVDILFSLVRPHKAYFGEKDFQQLAIVQAFSSEKYPDIEIVACPIIRNDEGLALSSRNALLTESQKKEALIISSILTKLGELSAKMSPKEVKNWVYAHFENESPLVLEYFELVHANNFEELQSWDDDGVALIAAYCGTVRLIDNHRLAPLYKFNTDTGRLQDQIG